MNDESIENSIEIGLSFKLSADDLKLIAIVQPCSDRIELTVEIVKARLKAAELSHLFINEYLVSELTECYNRSMTDKFAIEIGERRDATCEIVVSQDKMKAKLFLTPNFGGKSIELENIQKELNDKGIVFGISPMEEIEAILEKCHVSDFLIAKGIEPIPGIDAEFINLTPETVARKPLIDEEGNVDYRELGNIVTVKKDEVLMKRIPPIKGEQGRDVFGQIVEPSGGLDIPFSSDQIGVHVNPENENELLSSITGQPVVVPNGIIVTPVLTVKSVDLSSGNISFDGSVIVLGDVETGMKVRAGEDITIDGNVSNAQIECNGNLVIKGSVTGNSELVADGDISVKGGIHGYTEKEKKVFLAESKPTPSTTTPAEPTTPLKEYVAKLVARGSVFVGFAENFIIEAGIDIVVDKYSMNNNLMAANNIAVGNKTNKKSAIIGGITWAMLSVRTSLIGSSSGIRTRVQAGTNPYIQRRVSEIKDVLLQYHNERQNIHKILAWLENNPEKGNQETLDRLHHTLSRLVLDSEKNQAELKDLLSNMAVITGARVISERGVYVGSEIKINKAMMHVQENIGKSVFKEQKRKVVVIKDRVL